MKIFQRAKIFANVFFVLFFLSCTSLTKENKVYEKPNYSEKDVFENEKKRILKTSEKESVKALWLSHLLGDEQTIAHCTGLVRMQYKKALSEKNYFDALKLFQSLRACGIKESELENETETSLEKKAHADVPGTKIDKTLLPKTIDDCINATVTVWVDRGIAIQKGIGFADIVIGSGFFIDKRGWIITNHHVIQDVVDTKNEKYSRLYIKLAKDSDTKIPAKVVGWDAILDLALLKAEVDAPVILQLGKSSDLKMGDKVSAIGTPIGLEGTLTQGIVSATNRKLFTTGSVLQIDAAVNSGNSGGPLIDENMKVQAIVFAGIMQYQGLNFAIPVEYLIQDLPFLFHGGAREHSWINAYGKTKKTKDGKKNVGLEIQYVMPGGSAHRASFEAGDVIVSLNGEKISSLEDMQDKVRNFTSATIANVSYLRGDEKKNELVYLAHRPINPGYEMYESDLLSGSAIPIFGMKLISSSTLSKRTFTIQKILTGSIADESDFSENDPITFSNIKFDDDKKILYASVNTRRRKKGFLDISMLLASPLDSPYYF